VRKIALSFICMLIAVFFSGYGIAKDNFFDLKKAIKSRPKQEVFLFDYAKLLDEFNEYTNRHLETIRDRFYIETLIVSIPSSQGLGSIEEIAAEMLTNWEIGRRHEGRGLLLLFIEDTKEVKLEVSYELEDVFTDVFCGYVEDLQLRPNFLSGELGIGFIAVMEEFENRAHIKHQGEYTPGFITQLDNQLLSGGAGAKRDISKFKKEEVKSAASSYPAGRTPEEAWQTMIRVWKDGVTDPNLGLYTEVMKLAYRDFQNSPAFRLKEYYNKWGHRPYEVIQNDDYAVIFFGKKKGWENAPFLLSRTEEGWKMDIVHQRRYIRMGNAPHWGVERSGFPHMELLKRCPYWMNQDIPWEDTDKYTIAKDKEIAQRLVRLEEMYKENPDAFDVAVELGRLNAITSMRPHSIFPILKKAKQLNPESPLPYKYLGIAHLNATYQYRSAIDEIKEFVKREPASVFGHSYLGYLYLCIGENKKAAEALEKALELDPDSYYVYCKLSRAYGGLYLNSNKLNPSRNSYKEKSIAMYRKARETQDTDKMRIGWLRKWLRKKQILTK